VVQTVLDRVLCMEERRSVGPGVFGGGDPAGIDTNERMTMAKPDARRCAEEEGDWMWERDGEGKKRSANAGWPSAHVRVCWAALALA
jgi:hypothetical protein